MNVFHVSCQLEFPSADFVTKLAFKLDLVMNPSDVELQAGFRRELLVALFARVPLQSKMNDFLVLDQFILSSVGFFALVTLEFGTKMDRLVVKFETVFVSEALAAHPALELLLDPHVA